jgi:hypothetical protein
MSESNVQMIGFIDGKLRRLLEVTLQQEARIAERDSEIQAVHAVFAGALAKGGAEIATLTEQLEVFYGKHPAEDGRKSIQFAHGLIGVRSPAHPALVPLSDRWPWDKIERKLRRVFKLRFFHKPKPPGIDKVKVKRDLSVEQLATLGMKLDDTEHFYVELNRLALSGVK